MDTTNSPGSFLVSCRIYGKDFFRLSQFEVEIHHVKSDCINPMKIIQYCVLRKLIQSTYITMFIMYITYVRINLHNLL